MVTLVCGVVLGFVLTVAHRATAVLGGWDAPIGLILGLVAAIALLIGCRLLWEHRLPTAAAAIGLVATQRSLAHAYMRRGLLVEPFPVRPPSPWNYYLTESQLSKGNIARTVREWILSRAREDAARP